MAFQWVIVPGGADLVGDVEFGGCWGSYPGWAGYVGLGLRSEVWARGGDPGTISLETVTEAKKLGELTWGQ